MPSVLIPFPFAVDDHQTKMGAVKGKLARPRYSEKDLDIS